jgi:hypothetical protein
MTAPRPEVSSLFGQSPKNGPSAGGTEAVFTQQHCRGLAKPDRIRIVSLQATSRHYPFRGTQRALVGRPLNPSLRWRAEYGDGIERSGWHLVVYRSVPTAMALRSAPTRKCHSPSLWPVIAFGSAGNQSECGSGFSR